MKDRKQWLVWRYEDTRKVPYYPCTKRRRSGRMQSDEDLANLSTYDDACHALKSDGRPFTGLGFAVLPGDVFIDFDDIRDVETTIIHDDWCREFINDVAQRGAFVEVSQSGAGVHILGSGTVATAGHKQVNIEVYGERRFVAITGRCLYADQLPEASCDLMPVIDLVKQEYARRRQQLAPSTGDSLLVSQQHPQPGTVHGQTVAQLAILLSCFDADDRDTWVKIGLALGRAYPDNAEVFALYADWSSTSTKHTEADSKTTHDIFHRQAHEPTQSAYTLDSMIVEADALGVIVRPFHDHFPDNLPAHALAERTIVFAWHAHQLTLDEWHNPPPPKRFIIDRVLPAARTAMIGRGGLGKTMLLLYEALHVASGCQLYGQLDILEPGRVLIITAEEERSLLTRRTASLLDRLPWTQEQKRDAFTGLAIHDVSTKVPRLIGQDRRGEFHVTPWTDKLIKGYSGADVRWIIFDPISAFGLNENAMNDSAVVIMEAASRMSEELSAAVTLVHHTSKEGARNNIVDVHSGRGGSAFGDASRSTRVLTSRINLPSGTPAYDPETRTARLTLHHVKNSYAAPLSPFNIDMVDGYDIHLAEPVVPSDDEAAFWSRMGEVIAQEETLLGHLPSVEVLSRSNGFGVSRDVIRRRLMDGVAVGRLVLVDHPTDKRKRGVRFVKDWDGF